MGARKIYFGAGPAALPAEVLEEAARAVVDYEGSGLSILELPHRGKAFQGILDESRSLVRELCSLGEDYEVLWLPGGARLQFSMIPMNFLPKGKSAGYLDSGHWAHEAMEAATRYGAVEVLSSSADSGYTRLPILPKKVSNDLAYVHITTNNTIYGTQWPGIPDCPVPLIADMSSDIFSSSRDYNKCALFYAVAQKNLGMAGVTLVVIHRELLQGSGTELPDMLSYAAHAKAGSLLNTPPVFAVYVSLLMLRWIARKTVTTLESENRQKATMLYEELAKNPLFQLPVDRDSRSQMNVIFRGRDEGVEERFLAFSREFGIEGIEGHRSVGGFRASLYNAVSPEQVEVLVKVLQDFVQQPETAAGLILPRV